MAEQAKVLSPDEIVEQQLVSYGKISSATSFKEEMIAVAHRTIAKGTTMAELMYFLTVCKNVNLNPFNKEVWCYKNGQGDLLVFTGRDGFLARGQQHKDWGGMRSSEVCVNDEFELDIANNQIVHKIKVGDRGEIIGAYAIVFVTKKEPTIEWVNIKDYDKKRNTWNAFKAAMIKKVAESNALKKAFGITGLISEYDYEIKDGIAQNFKIDELKKPEDKSEERIISLIGQCKSKTELEKFKKECKTQRAGIAYDAKLKELSER